MNTGPIGVDVGAAYIAAAQVREGAGGAPALHAAVRFERARPGTPLSVDEAARTLDVLDRQGFVGNTIVSCAPLARQISAVMELPTRASGAPVDVLARAEIARQHRLDVSRVQAQCWDLPVPPKTRGGETGPVMAVGCTISDAESILHPLLEAGADVAALDARCVALARGAGLADAAATGSRLALALDLEMEASLLVVTVDGVVVYERVLPEASLGGLCERVSSKHGLDPAMAMVALREAGAADDAAPGERTEWPALGSIRSIIGEFAADIGREVSVSSGYAGQRFPQAAGHEGKARLALTGEGARIGGLARRIAERAGLPVATAQRARAPERRVAMGLALHHVRVQTSPAPLADESSTLMEVTA